MIIIIIIYQSSHFYYAEDYCYIKSMLYSYIHVRITQECSSWLCSHVSESENYYQDISSPFKGHRWLIKKINSFICDI